ncbi:RecB family exonuclease [Fimbriimonas ginsengisoli]|uniref:RecB family exonuclease n=1 Tax=Fimbriimonas ginsengisoli Gsoil 348 TaxID=661478 RepID=A0A068NW26_FIMGI|nr:PD-(D/E)XK nuclease family protein [Fimbriimonas ginsengisoli]AIE87537.1 RecB family exonuclease [Fimbriimonas ginsengisoli Gsoil 348]
MARKPTLSPSKITTYLACPVKYRWTYVDDRGKWYLRSKSYYSFGSTLHRVLERFHDTGDAGVNTTEEVMAAYEESWIDAGYASAEELAEAYGEGREILERHVQQATAQPRESKTIFVERQFRHDMGEFALLGRVDRVDEYPDGTLEIVDYKSGRESVEVEDVATDIAMACYQLLLRHKFPGVPIRARIIALRTGHSAAASMTDEEAADFEQTILQLGREILSEEYHELTPVFKPLCLHCDFLPLCRKHPEFAEL